MAIYHFSATVISRTQGGSSVRSAAYRSAERLEELRTGETHDYTRKRGVEHKEILAPDNAPAWVHDRAQLWNAAEAVEKRKDAQLARNIDVALPVELGPDAQVALLRNFVRREFVSKGMIADCAIHRDNPDNPHAHILITLRKIDSNGFGLKERSWNTRAQLQAWRIGWEELANGHLARAGLTVRIDHRTLLAQGLDLIPGRKIGVGLERQRAPDLPLRIAERVAEQDDIAHTNGARIVANPKVAIQALSHYRGTFTERDIGKFLHTRTYGAEQFRNAYLKVSQSAELMPLDPDEHGHKRYTTRERLELERQKRLQAIGAKLTAEASMADIDARQQMAAERWRDKHFRRAPGLPPDPTVPLEQRHEPTYKGPEDEFEL